MFWICITSFVEKCLWFGSIQFCQKSLVLLNVCAKFILYARYHICAHFFIPSLHCSTHDFDSSNIKRFYSAKCMLQVKRTNENIQSERKREHLSQWIPSKQKKKKRWDFERNSLWSCLWWIVCVCIRCKGSETWLFVVLQYGSFLFIFFSFSHHFSGWHTKSASFGFHLD